MSAKDSVDSRPKGKRPGRKSGVVGSGEFCYFCR